MWKCAIALVFIGVWAACKKEGDSKLDQLRGSPVERGALLAKKLGCMGCHSVDGSPKNGPSFKGLLGSERVLRSGARVVADIAYLERSIAEPNKEVVGGFEPIMPEMKKDLSPEVLSDLVKYIAAQK